MTALSAENVSKVKFHLGYNYGVPAQDLARLTRACNEVADEWTKTKIETQIARCETAYDLQDLEAGAFNPQFETEVTGDIGRVIQTKEKDPYSRRQRFYLEATNYLARTLGIRNYRDPSQADQGFLVDGGLYVNSIEGPQGPQGSIIPDAPSDGSVYGRSDAAWVLVQGGAQADWDATSGQAQILNKPDLSIYMQSLLYDPGGVSANVFDLSNHTGSIDGGTFT